MRFEIWSASESEIEKEKTVTLGLRHDEDGGVDLVVLDNDGEIFPSGYLLNISQEGIYRVPNINPCLKFGLDGSGRVALIIPLSRLRYE